MIVLDTDILTLVQRATSVEYYRLIARIQTVPDEPVCVTIVSFEEQMRGWLAYSARARGHEQQIQAYSRLRGLLEDFQTRPVLDFDDRAAEQFQRLVRAKVRIGTMDLRVAAICLVHKGTLLSRNLVDFRTVPGLRAEDWTIEPISR